MQAVGKKEDGGEEKRTRDLRLLYENSKQGSCQGLRPEIKGRNSINPLMLDAIMVIRGEVESYLPNQASRISITHQHQASASNIKESGKVYKLFYLLHLLLRR